MQITIYTDGACDIHAENQPGGWAAILRATDDKGELLRETVISGGAEGTTNNRMELTAVIEALKKLSDSADVTVFTDSKYVIDIATGKHRIRANRDLWRAFFAAESRHSVKWEFIAGHSGDEFNDRCDKLAVAEREIYRLGKANSSRDESGKHVATRAAVYVATKLSVKQGRVAWAACLYRGDQVETVAGIRDDSTKYEALLRGAIRSLSLLDKNEVVTLHATEKNLVESINNRVDRWKQNNWQYTYQNEVIPVKHKELWQHLLQLKTQRKIEFTYSKELRNSEQYALARKLANFLLSNTL